MNAIAGLDGLIDKAYDYVVQVLETQRVFLSDDDMYNGYKSVFSNKTRLTKPNFMVVYSEIKTICLNGIADKDVLIKEANHKEVGK